VWLGR